MVALLVPQVAIAKELDLKLNSSDTVLVASTSVPVIEPVATTTQARVADKIKVASIKYGVDTSIALNIACAEGNMGRALHNPVSTASGVYHFLDSSWKLYGLHHWGSLEDRDKLNEDDSIDLAMRTIAEEGTGPWNASKWSGFGGGWASQPYERGLCN